MKRPNCSSKRMNAFFILSFFSSVFCHKSETETATRRCNTANESWECPLSYEPDSSFPQRLLLLLHILFPPYTLLFRLFSTITVKRKGLQGGTIRQMKAENVLFHMNPMPAFCNVYFSFYRYFCSNVRLDGKGNKLKNLFSHVSYVAKRVRKMAKALFK